MILYVATRDYAGTQVHSVRLAKPLPISEAATEVKLTVLPTLGSSSPQRKSDEAYVALYYGSFFLTLRVLGQSLRDTGTTRDMVALCMSDVPPYHRDILKKEGWIVKAVDPLPRECVGNHLYSQHFVKVQTWLLTEYRRVVLIDSDAIALKNIDALFNCGEFCAAYRHSDLFNTGVVVLKPSGDTFRNICANIRVFGSFTNGDQGFLNYFYEDLKKATLFSHDTNVDSTGSNEKQMQPKFQRLPAEYNGDVAVYYLANRWMYLDTDEPYVLHYTLGPVKPWKWWTYPLFTLNWKWQKLRERLPRTSLTEPSLCSWESWLPIPLLVAAVFATRFGCRRYTRAISNCFVVKWAATPLIRRRTVGRYCTTIFPIATLFFACYSAFYSVPLSMSPIPAWTCFGLWLLFFFFGPFSVLCHLAYLLGMHAPVHYEGVDGSIEHKRTITPWRIGGEILVWLVLSISLFYMQFFVTTTQLTMKKRTISFFGFGIANILLCCWCGQHILLLCHKRGCYEMPHNFFKMPSPLHIQHHK